ncbi:MAG TPA: bifunctional ADP-dependent (S)-NAD(P)H-hydrate dehydratase/NAD(P)H-hydrate epimerase, partial [Actinotalea sp.]|nr:bifunctional ADP-dependent (S)-NAD(P)H-hydrate dehydratase/NAD(P)H-hydrate epimerase [Actinotalea sp.]
LGALLAGLAPGLDDGPGAVPRAVAAAVAVHGLAARVAGGGGPLTASGVAAAVPGVVRDLVTGRS